jgi:hypothetical protein
MPTHACEACGQVVELRAALCPRCGFPQGGGPKLGRSAGGKSPRRAMWFSLAWPGAGHLYAGDSEKALIFGGAAAVLCVLSVTVIGAVVGMLAWLGLALNTAIDSGRKLLG